MEQKESLITRIHLLGMPGSGKDTNAIFLRDKFPNISDIVSTGDIFRGANTPEGEYGCYYPMLKSYIENTNNGALLPDELIVQIINIEIKRRVQKSFTRFIFTGYPRTLKQLEEINKSPQNDIFIFLDCSVENVQLRIRDRYFQDIEAQRPTRQDDLPEKFQKRLKSFNESTLPLIAELRIRGDLITIDANKKPDQVAQEIQQKVIV